MAHTSNAAEWNEVFLLRPKLADTVTVNREYMRGEFRYILTVSSPRGKHKLKTSAYQFIGRCDGINTVQQIWDEMQNSLVGNMLTQGEIATLIGQLQDINILQFNDSNVKVITQRQKSIPKFMSRLAAPLSFLAVIFARR